MTNPRLFPVVALGALVLATLAGCGASAEPSPTPTAGSSVSSSPTSSPSAEPSPGTITIGATELTVTSSAGDVLATYGQFDDPVTVVAGLTDILGFAPTVEENAAPYEGFAYRMYRWDGLLLNDTDLPSDGQSYEEYTVTSTAPDVRGIAVESADGVSVGDSIETVAAAHPDTTTRLADPSGAEFVRVVLASHDLPAMPTGEPVAFEVLATGPEDGTVTSVFQDGGGPRF